MHIFMVPIWYCALKMTHKMRQLGRKCSNPMVSIVNYIFLLLSDKLTHSNTGKHLNLIFNAVIFLLKHWYGNSFIAYDPYAGYFYY